LNVSRDDFVDGLLRSGAVVAIGVSGGKDSDVAVFETLDYLDGIGHAGPRLLIHSDLGDVEWDASLPQCQRLAEAVGLELVVVRRKAGGLLTRWRTRWRNNVARFAELSCVQLILPWSTPAMRFCTSEMKTDVICAELTRRFPGQTIISVAGIRREESEQRRNAPVFKLQPKLCRSSRGTLGYDWNPILDYTLQDVQDVHVLRGFPLHEAYTVYGASRVSCRYCIFSTLADLTAATADPRGHDLYRALVDLEAESTFSFQGNRWLADVAPSLLPEDLARRTRRAKEGAVVRTEAASRVPRHLLYEAGWPKVMPSAAEAEILAQVRSDVSDAVGITIKYTDADGVMFRYKELLREKKLKEPITKPGGPVGIRIATRRT
jgi:3'-phosphoadenosine 5'-phosphosulfate sulfotransferase (PAPS reductase)/FAD synthetase